MRAGLIVGLGLCVALTGSLAQAQSGTWVIVASEPAAMAVAQGVNRGDAERRALSQCATRACRITEARVGGCAGAVRLFPAGTVRTFDGASRSEWDAWLIRQCPTRNCQTVITCAPAVSSTTPNVPSVPSIPGVPKLPTFR